ncbi:MAG: hypothetical protein ACLFV2_05705 [Desulfurivibrionaceae bacterium]
MDNKKQSDDILTLDTVFTCLDILSRANALATEKNKRLSEDLGWVIDTLMMAYQLNETDPEEESHEKKTNKKKYYQEDTDEEITDLLTGKVIYRS